MRLYNVTPEEHGVCINSGEPVPVTERDSPLPAFFWSHAAVGFILKGEPSADPEDFYLQVSVSSPGIRTSSDVTRIADRCGAWDELSLYRLSPGREVVCELTDGTDGRSVRFRNSGGGLEISTGK